MDWMTVLAVSALAAWILLLAEGFVLLALVRQIGVLHARVAPRSSRDTGRDGPAVGTLPPQVEVLPIDGGAFSIGAPTTKPTAYLFVSLTCTLCRDVLSSVPALQRSVGDEVTLRVLVRGDPPDAQRIRNLHRLPLDVAVAAAHRVFEAYQVESTPLMIVLSSDGRVLSKGIVNTLEQMEVAIELVVHAVSTDATSLVPTRA